MAEGFVNVTEGSGKKLHTFNRAVGGNDVHDEGQFVAEANFATYQVSCTATSVATANSHVLTINAGASLNVYIRRIMIFQIGLATTAAYCEWDFLRTTTAAPTGGTAFTPIQFNSTEDGASGATAMTLPTVKATEGNPLGRYTGYFVQTANASAVQSGPHLDMNFDSLRMKAPRIAAGTTNGICIKNLTAIAAATVRINVWFNELNY